MHWLVRIRRLLRLGSAARIAAMVIAGFVAMTIIGAAVEQRRLGGNILTRAIRPQMGEWALAILQSSSALGVLSMVLIQSFKQPLRGRFHRRILRQWLCSSENIPSVTENREEVFDKVLDLIAPSYQHDILSLPIEQLSAQLASAADVALLSHKEDLLYAFAGPSAHSNILRYKGLFSKQVEFGAGGEASLTPELLEIRNTISHIIQRRIDGFQIHVGNEWRVILRIMAIILSGGLAALSIFISGEHVHRPFTAVAFALTVGLLGGLLASVARDLVAIVEKYRR